MHRGINVAPVLPAGPAVTPTPPLIRGRRLAGVLYIRADDVITALESDEFPDPAAAVIRKLRAAT